MFITQRQMMARNAAEGPAATQQKVMMYVFPVFLAVISFNFPLAVVLYWVTTNIWQGVQQWIMFRVTTEDDGEGGAQKPATRGTPSSGSGGSNGKKPSRGSSTGEDSSDRSNGRPEKKPDSAAKKSGSHLPKRKRN